MSKYFQYLYTILKIFHVDCHYCRETLMLKKKEMVLENENPEKRDFVLVKNNKQTNLS